MPELVGGCVGADLAVYGVRHLSVVDASYSVDTGDAFAGDDVCCCGEGGGCD